MLTGLSKGKAIYRIMSRSDAWKKRVDDYRRFSGATLEFGKDLNQLAQNFEKTSTGLQPSIKEAALDDRVQCITSCIEQLRTLSDIKPRLQEGATRFLEQKIFATVSEFWEHLDHRTHAEIALLSKLEQLMECVVLDGDKEVAALRQATSAQWPLSHSAEAIPNQQFSTGFEAVPLVCAERARH